MARGYDTVAEFTTKKKEHVVIETDGDLYYVFSQSKEVQGSLSDDELIGYLCHRLEGK